MAFELQDKIEGNVNLNQGNFQIPITVTIKPFFCFWFLHELMVSLYNKNTFSNIMFV